MLFIFYFYCKVYKYCKVVRGTVVASVPCYITFASRYKKHVTEAKIANKFVFSDFNVAALCNLGFTMSSSYVEQVWPSLIYMRSGKAQTKEPDLTT